MLAAAWLLPACTPAAPAPIPTALAQVTASPTVAPTHTLQPTAIPSSTASSTVNTSAPTATASPAATAQAPHAPQIIILAENVSGLDDLALAPDGSIYVSNINDGTIRSYAPNRAPQTLVSGLREPEGMVVLPDHSLIIAEQGKNRLARYDITTRMLTPLLQLENTTGQLGVDGIALDAHDPLSVTLIIPDSPNGRVLRANLDGELLGIVAQGLARPTSAAAEKDGSLLITDENANALKRIRPDGTIELIAALPTPDDVVVDDKGVIYVNTLGDGTIHRFVPGVMKDEAWVIGLSGPQGIVLDRAGNVVVTDTGHRRLISIMP